MATNTTTIDDLLPSIITEAMFQVEENSIMAGLVRNYSLPLGSGKTITVPKYTAQTATPVGEGVDLSGINNVDITTGSAELAVSEVGIMTMVTDLAQRTAASNVIADVGRLFGSAIARKIDQDLTALFAGFSTVLGDGIAPVTAASIFEAVARLRAQGITPDGLACVLHPEIAYDLKSSITSTFAAPASEVGNSAMRMGMVGMLAGIPVYESANITSTAGVSSGAVFHRDALGLATLTGINVEAQRDASLRATELNDAYGVGMSFDSSIV